MRLLLPAALTLALLTPGVAHAQGPTFQDSTGLTWSVATLEVGLLLVAITLVSIDPADSGMASLLATAASVVASGVLAGVTQALDAPVEPPMVFHHGFVGAALLGGLMSFSVRASGESNPDVSAGFGIAGLILGAAGSATYSVLRMERLAHDPQLLEETHVLSWGPLLTAALVTGVLGGLGLGDAAPIVGAVAGLLFLGAAMVASEVAIAENPPPGMMVAPLSSSSVRF